MLSLTNRAELEQEFQRTASKEDYLSKLVKILWGVDVSFLLAAESVPYERNRRRIFMQFSDREIGLAFDCRALGLVQAHTSASLYRHFRNQIEAAARMQQAEPPAGFDYKFACKFDFLQPLFETHFLVFSAVGDCIGELHFSESMPVELGKTYLTPERTNEMIRSASCRLEVFIAIKNIEVPIEEQVAEVLEIGTFVTEKPSRRIWKAKNNFTGQIELEGIMMDKNEIKESAIKLETALWLGNIELTLADLEKLRPGMKLEFDCPKTLPALLMVNGSAFAEVEAELPKAGSGSNQIKLNFTKFAKTGNFLENCAIP